MALRPCRPGDGAPEEQEALSSGSDPSPTRHARLHLLRHGEVEERWHGRIYGDEDVALSEVGLARFDALAEELVAYPFGAIYSSPLQRAHVGAEKIARSVGLEVHIDARFKEIHRGSWNGLSFAELDAKFPGAAAAYLADPDRNCGAGGETHVDLAARVVPALEDLAARHADEEILIVCHAQVMRAAVAALLGLPGAGSLRLMTYYGGFTTLDRYEDGAWVVQAVNQPTLRRGSWGGRTFKP